MDLSKILRAIEQEPTLQTFLAKRTKKVNWQTFTRTQFNFVATHINKLVTQRVLKHPFLLSDYLLIGPNKFETIYFKYKIEKPEALVRFLDPTSHRPFSWISGKTLESLWAGGRAKDLKLNVLLTYLDIPVPDWEEWKYPKALKNNPPREETLSFPTTKAFSSTATNKRFYANLRKYYLGSYYLYYLRTDNNQKIVKTPFIIKEDKGHIIVDSTSEGHRYKSHPIQKMMNNMYIVCQNLDWSEEFETHLFNIGLETQPEVIFGVSLTTTVKGGIPVAIKKILIKQSSAIDFLDGETEKNIPLKTSSTHEEEALVIKYFKQQSHQILFAEYCCSYNDFKEKLGTMEP